MKKNRLSIVNKATVSAFKKYSIIALLVISISACGNTLQSDRVKLIVALTATPEHIMIDNGNAYVWNDVKITINKDYFYESPLIPRGGSSYNLADFTKLDGTRFDPKQNRFRSLTIYVPEAMDGKPGYFTW
mgnify:CR=1 FL=1